MNLTPFTRRVSIVVLGACFFVSVLKGYPALAGVALGIIGTIISPEKKGNE